MRIKSDKNLRIATLWGSVVLLEAGVPKEVGDAVGLLALQQGAKEVGDGVSEVSIEATDVVTIRARNESGHYLPDDPSTPDINEAFVDVGVGDVTEVVEAIERLIADGNVTDFKKNGEPRAAAISKAVGRTVAPEERIKAWEQVINS